MNGSSNKEPNRIFWTSIKIRKPVESLIFFYPTIEKGTQWLRKIKAIAVFEELR